MRFNTTTIQGSAKQKTGKGPVFCFQEIQLLMHRTIHAHFLMMHGFVGMCLLLHFMSAALMGFVLLLRRGLCCGSRGLLLCRLCRRG
jgi:hypothetical protein